MTLLNISDTWVSQQKPSTTYGGDKVLRTRTGGSGDAYALLKPFSSLNRPQNAVVGQAKLQVFLQSAVSGSVTFTARLVTKSWASGTAKWSNRPTSTATDAVSVVVTDKPAGTLIEFDVSLLLTTAMGSGVLHGFEIRSSGTTLRGLHSANATNTKLRPKLDLVWVTPPEKPTGLVPASGFAVSKLRPTFGWLYRDTSGVSPMKAYQLELNYTNPTWSTADVVTGVVLSDTPVHTFGSDLTPDTPFFWRVRVQNVANQWSDWSNIVESIVTAKPTVTITYPTGNVADVTPPITWSVSTAYDSYEVRELVLGRLVQSSGVVAGNDGAFTLSKPLTFDPDATVEVRVWDAIPRVATPGDSTFAEASVTFGFEPDDTVDAVTSLTATVAGLSPVVELEWSYASVPDGFNIYRDGVLLERVTGVAVWEGSTDFAYVDAAAGAGVHSWTVYPVVNDAQSDDSPVATASISGKFAWLYSDDVLIPLISSTPLGAFGEQSEAVVVSGADRTIVKSQALRGREDSFSGVFDTRVDMSPVTTLSGLETNLRVLKAEPVRLWRLMVGKENIPVVVRNVSWAEVPGSNNQAIAVSFDYFQQGELEWVSV